MTRVVVIGAGGFVGSAFVRHLASRRDVDLVQVTRATYAAHRGTASDVVIDASGNAVKFLADRDPLADVDRSVVQRVRTLVDFPATLQVHVSSVDVYHDLTSPATTGEDAVIDLSRQSRYGFHKYLAELAVRHYAARWLIVRLAGMVGPGLKKNPVYDILHGQPLRIHPDSRYQFLHTDTVASLAWHLCASGCEGVTVNVCGDGVISPREIAGMAGRALDLSALPGDAEPRIVDVAVDALRRWGPVPATREEVARYCGQESTAGGGA